MRFPFDDAPNSAWLTCNHVIEEGEPILYVSHDEDDGMWQCLCGRQHEESEARIVSLHSVYMLDNSIWELTEMPCGYFAERQDKFSVWIIRRR